MSLYKYAQINLDTKVCHAVSYLSGIVNKKDMIRLNNNENPLGWTYDNGTWIEPEPVELEPKEEYVSNNEIKNMISNIEKTQLTLIQSSIEKSNNELRQEGADIAILELIKKGIL